MGSFRGTMIASAFGVVPTGDFRIEISRLLSRSYFLGSSPRIIHGTGNGRKNTAPQTNQARLERPFSAAYSAVKRPDKNATARTAIVTKTIQENMAAPIDALSI